MSLSISNNNDDDDTIQIEITQPNSINRQNTIQKTTQQTVINPTFLLRGIEYHKIISDYFDGKFNNISFPSKKIELSVNSIIADYSVGSDDSSEIYEYVNSVGQTQRVVTVNHLNHERVKRGLKNNSYLENIDEGITIPLSNGGKNICLWCRRNFSFEPVGMPIKFEYHEDKRKNIFHTIGTYCTYECCYSDLKTKTRTPFCFRDHRYMDSETMLRLLFGKVYPDKELKEQNDWVLGCWNNGPISEEDFFSDSHHYENNINVVFLPAKFEYSLSSSRKSTNVRG